MLEELLNTDFFAYINEHRPGNLPEWEQEPIVQEELIDDSVFDIVDMRGHAGSIKREQGQGEATYYNGDGTYRYALRFVRFEEFVNQFRTFRENGQTENDWTRGMSRPDYMVYNTGENRSVFIIHELSSGDIRSKHTDGRKQLLTAVVILSKIPSIRDYVGSFARRLCFLSAKGCVDTTPQGMADSFLEIYRHLPDPLPINNKSITNRGFEAFESNVIKL